MTDMTQDNKELLAGLVSAAIERVGGDKNDKALFNTVYTRVEKAYTEPCLKLMLPSFELLPEGQERQLPSIETRAALIAHGWFLNELEFVADLARWFPKGLMND